ncbi:galactose-1-phosphate uridylyltransferase [Dermacoccaceae bacterium W4C1]
MTSSTSQAASPGPSHARRTRGRLADGREIIWYDARGSAPRTPAADTRPLPPHEVSSQMRLDVLTGQWITIAAQRQSRTFMPDASQCPLCPSRPGHLSEVPSAEYQVVAFENRFPSLAQQIVGVEPLDDGVSQVRPATGRCEVLCFTSDHDGSFTDLTPAQARLVVDAWADRTAELSALEHIEHVFCFENRGKDIGVTLQHPHGQIYAYPFVPPQAATEMAQAAAHRERTGRHLMADVLDRELRDGTRIVARNEHWVAFVPFAARWPIEVHVVPLTRHADLTTLDDAERDAFAELYLQVLRRCDGLYPTPLPYVAAWNQAPVHSHRQDAWLHLKLFSIRRGADRLKYLAGSETGMGAFIGDVLPEEQAARLRAVELG